MKGENAAYAHLLTFQVSCQHTQMLTGLVSSYPCFGNIQYIRALM